MGDGTIASDADFAQAVDYMTSLILGIFTTRKYRLLTSFYLLWRVLDYAMLTVIVFSVISVEIFYDVLQFMVKIWILNRVSIFIGFALYGLYIFAFTYHALWNYLVYSLLIVRFIAFLFEEFIDYCIDLELQYDISEKCLHKLEVPICIKTEFEERIALLHVSKNRIIECAQGWEFKGSLCVWTSRNTFKVRFDEKFQKDKNGKCTWYRFVFHLMFAVTYCVIGIPLLIIIALSVSCLALIRFCCKRKSDSILDECFNRYSY